MEDNYDDKFKPGNNIKTYNFFCNMITTLKYLKDNNIIHADLKPENIIIDKNDDYNLTKFKLCDFGSSIFSHEKISNLPPLPYRAPELINDDYYSFEIDLWSLGCILWEILILDNLLFDDNDEKKVYNKQLQLCSSEYNLLNLIDNKLSFVNYDDDELFLQNAKSCELRSIFTKLINISPKERAELCNFIPIANDSKITTRRKSSPSY